MLINSFELGLELVLSDIDYDDVVSQTDYDELLNQLRRASESEEYSPLFYQETELTTPIIRELQGYDAAQGQDQRPIRDESASRGL
jgi:hypothetical protein